MQVLGNVRVIMPEGEYEVAQEYRLPIKRSPNIWSNLTTLPHHHMLQLTCVYCFYIFSTFGTFMGHLSYQCVKDQWHRADRSTS